MKKIIKFGLSLVGPIVMIVILTMPIGPLAGGLGILQPIGGIFDVGRAVTEPTAQTVNLPGLTAQATVLVDQWGIPHIYASTVEDAYMALGYLHAKDRLFQMVIQNYLAEGRICELVGAYAASSDRFYRTIGLARAAQKTLDWYVANSANPDIAFGLKIIDAECTGVNAFINSMTSVTTPLEFKILGFTPQPWTRLDVFVWAKMMTWGLSGDTYDLEREWVRTTVNNDTMYNQLYTDVMPFEIPIVPEQTNLSIVTYPNAPGNVTVSAYQQNPIVEKTAAEALIPQAKLQAVMKLLASIIQAPGPDDIIGSNNWAVNGSKSTTGKPILCNDPHLGLQAPSLWYEAQIVVPGQLNVMGVTLPGLPAVLLGHNDHIAWGFTNVGADVTDVFVEKLNPANSSQYWYNGHYVPLKVYDETIHTKEGTDIPFQVKESVHGPLIDSALSTYGTDTESQPNLAMNWTGYGVTHELLAAEMLNRATNLTQYFDALYFWDSPPQNIIYADIAGHIAITCAGRYPIRAGYTGEYPVAAYNDSVGMVSYIPYAYIPRSVDPAQGYLSSANQRSIDSSKYGYKLLGPFDDGYRGRRINYLLNSTPTVSVDDMKRFQADSLEVAAQQIVPYVVAAWDWLGDGNSTIDSVANELSSWNYVMDTDTWAPTVWMYLKDAIHYMTFDELRSINPDLPLSRTPVLEKLIKDNNAYYFDDHTTTGKVETRDQILVEALHRAVDQIVQQYGNDKADWLYGLHHRVYLDHLAGFTYIGGGPARGQQTLNAAGGWRVTHGPSWRMVADLSNLQKSYGVYPGGQSGNMFSPHWDDLFKLWYAYNKTTQQYGYHPMYFYSTAAAFQAADTAGTMIERTITFVG